MRIIKHAGKIVHSDLLIIDCIYEKLVRSKAASIMNDHKDLERYYTTMRSGFRLRGIQCRTQRYLQSFVPHSVNIMNN